VTIRKLMLTVSNLQASDIRVVLVGEDKVSTVPGVDVVPIGLGAVEIIRLPEVGDIGRIENAGGSGVGRTWTLLPG
jgi:hypothetical protein